MLEPSRMHRLRLGHFTLRREGEPPRKVVVAAFLIDHPEGLVLFDTGIGEGDADAERRYTPVRRPLAPVVAAAGFDLRDVRIVANCHLHADHAGGNPLFPSVPIVVQRVEHDAAREPGYTIPSLIDFARARYEHTEGEAEVYRGIRVVPTPGHAPGHQSLVVQTTQGTYVLAGQAVNFASDYAAAHLAWELHRDGETDVPYPQWIAALERYDPRRVLFAHDDAIWESNALG